MIRKSVQGRILDLGCGSASYWKGFDGQLVGIDFSSAAIAEAKKNYPLGLFFCQAIPTDMFEGLWFDIVVLSGVVNYYRDLTPIISMLQGIGGKGTTIIITINVLQDFPDRNWTAEYIDDIFFSLGIVSRIFVEKVGWFITIERL